jgi:hypothetical protein
VIDIGKLLAGDDLEDNSKYLDLNLTKTVTGHPARERYISAQSVTSTELYRSQMKNSGLCFCVDPYGRTFEPQ